MGSSTRRMLGVLGLLAAVSLGLPTQPALGQSDPTPVLTAGGTISYAPGDGAVPIDPELTITAGDDAVLDAAVVSIGTGFLRTQDALGIAGQDGTSGTVENLSWTYDDERGLLRITGEASVEDYEGALRQVTYSNSRPTPLVTDRSVSISLGSALYFDENGHFYEFVPAQRIPWTDAKPAAEARIHAGRRGYLATITSAGENEFVAEMVVGKGWLGASDADHDKEWDWTTGPEAGTHFFTQASDEDGCGAGPAEEQPPGDRYENWDASVPEPNDFPSGCAGDEDYGHIQADGSWNDRPDIVADVSGYVVEFGGIFGEPMDATVDTIVIQADMPSITIEATWIGDDRDALDDSDLATSFVITPDVDGCTEEQTVSLPAGETSLDVSIIEAADETPCTYSVTATPPGGYTASPDDVTGVELEGTAAFTITQTPGALPRTGATNPLYVVLGLALAGSGSVVLGGGRRRWSDDNSDRPEHAGDAEVLTLFPDDAWTQRSAPSAAVPAPIGSTFSDAINPVEPDSAGSEFAEAVAPPQLPLEETTPAETSSLDDEVSEASDEMTEACEEQEPVGANGIVEDLLRLMDDLAED